MEGGKREPLLPAASLPLPARLRRSLLCRTVGLFAIGYGLCFIDRSNISFGELTMSKDPSLHFTTTDFSLSAGIFFAGYAIAQLPAVHVV